ncbi:unnamed protein product, partial [Ectocarpus sp. 6 AP-2014]
PKQEVPEVFSVVLGYCRICRTAEVLAGGVRTQPHPYRLSSRRRLGPERRACSPPFAHSLFPLLSIRKRP